MDLARAGAVEFHCRRALKPYLMSDVCRLASVPGSCNSLDLQLAPGMLHLLASLCRQHEITLIAAKLHAHARLSFLF